MTKLQTSEVEAPLENQGIESSEERGAPTRFIKYESFIGEDKLFSSMKLLDRKYTATAWSTNPEIRRRDALDRLHTFYMEIINGRNDEAKVYLTDFPVSIIEHSAIPPKYAVPPYISNILHKMNEMPNKKTIMLLFDSPYVNFGIQLPSQEDYRAMGLEVPSRLERIMFTISQEDISRPLSQLISATSAYQAKEESIIEQLRKAHSSR